MLVNVGNLDELTSRRDVTLVAVSKGNYPNVAELFEGSESL